MPVCGCCHADLLGTAPPMKCSRCSQVHYCNESCQREDWPKHKPTCAASVDFTTAMALYRGRGIVKDDTESLRLLVRAAKSSNADAQAELGRRYAKGEGGVCANDVLSSHWYRKAAEAGHIMAQFNLAVRYDKGHGVEKDVAVAAHWYRKAADAGYLSAQFNLGICYADGLGVEKDAIAAVHWYRKAAEAGHVKAQASLGLCYVEGRGIAKDLVTAIYLFNKAAIAGDARAQNCLAVCYYTGRGGKQDIVRAIHWFRKAAEAGDTNAQFYLGECYELGFGFEQDITQAVHWYGLAAIAGFTGAQARLAVIRATQQDKADDVSVALSELTAALSPLACVAAGCTEPGLLACSRCRAVLYCSQACQRTHRKAHKVYCNTLAVPAESGASTPSAVEEGGLAAMALALSGDTVPAVSGGSASSH
jgi:uncharacterized protein